MSLSKSDLDIKIQSDFEILNAYLIEVKDVSDNSHRVKKSFLVRALNKIAKPIREINRSDIRNYCKEVLDKQPIKYTSKVTYKGFLADFFDFVDDLSLDKKSEYYNPDYVHPVRSLKIKFNKKERDITLETSKSKQRFSRNELMRFQSATYDKDFRDFTAGSIMCANGWRGSEVFTIKRCNVDLENRYIESGIVKNAKKSGHALLGFIPIGLKDSFETYLKHYLEPSSIWLFPSPKGSYLRAKSYSAYFSGEPPYKKYDNLERFSHTHWFRGTLITERFLLGCPDGFNEGLTGHSGDSTEYKFYMKLSPEEKRIIYDYYFPYYEFPFFRISAKQKSEIKRKYNEITEMYKSQIFNQ